MGHRTAIPLYKTRHVAFVEALKNCDKPDRAIGPYLSFGTGPRGDTVCHTHASWFTYNHDGALYYRIPKSDPCRKYGDTTPCGDCNKYDHDEYSPKTPAAEGRRILIKNEWTNPVTGEREYFGLRDAVENYFGIESNRAPDGVQHGNKMIDGDGISLGTLNADIRRIAAQSDISPSLRRERLEEELTIEDEADRERDQITDWGRDSDGNGIPDITSHDGRASYITQLMRNDMPRTKALTKTGHKNVETLSRYVSFAEGEIDEQEEDQYY